MEPIRRSTHGVLVYWWRAQKGLDYLRHRRWVGRDWRPLDREPPAQVVPVGDLREWMKRELARSFVSSAPFVVDAHFARHDVGVGNPQFGPFPRTSVGWWEVRGANVLALDHVCHSWHGLDTFHWDGSFGWPAQLPKTSYYAGIGDHFAERFGPSRREQQRVVDVPQLWASPPPGDLAHGYVVASTDRVTSDLTFRYFHDELSALAWLLRYEQELDRRWRVEPERLVVIYTAPGGRRLDRTAAKNRDMLRPSQVATLIGRSSSALPSRSARPAWWTEFSRRPTRLWEEMRLARSQRFSREDDN